MVKGLFIWNGNLGVLYINGEFGNKSGVFVKVNL